MPTSGAAVRLTRGHLEACGEIAWESGDYRGLRFDAPVDVQSWVKRIGHSGQHDVDKKLAMLRRRGHSHPAELLTGDLSGADNLSHISVDLDRLCEELTASATMTVELGDELIRLDTIAQRLRKIAVLAD